MCRARGSRCISPARSWSGCIRSARYSTAQDGPMQGNTPPGRQNPEQHRFELHDPFTKDPDSVRVNTNSYTLNLQSATHWDSLAHVEYAGRLYNGFPVSSIDESGARKLGI